jgi:hypothetical protein
LTVLSLVGSSSAVFAGSNAVQPAVETPADADQQVKCRKIQVTGSLIRKGKVCRTLAEWKRLQQSGNDAARLMAGEHGCSGGECRGLEIQSEIGPLISPR